MANTTGIPLNEILDINIFSCENVGDIFLLAQKMGFDDDDFAEKYMNSEFVRTEIDAEYSHCHSAWCNYVMDELLDEITPKKNDKHYSPDAFEWAGYMYRYVHMRLGTPSSLIYKTLPLEKMLILYEGMHTVTEEYFIDDIKDSFPEVFYECSQPS